MKWSSVACLYNNFTYCYGRWPIYFDDIIIYLSTIAGWWFGTFFIFPYIGLLIIPIDVHIFQRGSNHQPDQQLLCSLSICSIARCYESSLRTTWCSQVASTGDVGEIHRCRVRVPGRSLHASLKIKTPENPRDIKGREFVCRVCVKVESDELHPIIESKLHFLFGASRGLFAARWRSDWHHVQIKEVGNSTLNMIWLIWHDYPLTIQPGHA